MSHFALFPRGFRNAVTVAPCLTNAGTRMQVQVQLQVPDLTELSTRYTFGRSDASPVYESDRQHTRIASFMATHAFSSNAFRLAKSLDDAFCFRLIPNLVNHRTHTHKQSNRCTRTHTHSPTFHPPPCKIAYPFPQQQLGHNPPICTIAESAVHTCLYAYLNSLEQSLVFLGHDCLPRFKVFLFP